MNREMELALLRKLLKQTTAAYEQQIHKLANSEQELRNNEKRLQDILNNIDAYVYMKDTQGRYEYANKAVCELWNTRLEDVVGKDDSAFFDVETTQQIHNNDRKVMVDGLTLKVEERNVVKEGEDARTYLSTKMPLRDAENQIVALLGVSTDITERVQAEEKLRLASMVYESSSEAIMVTDANDHILAINPAFEHMTGYRYDQVIGKTPKILNSELHDVEFFEQFAKELNKTGSWSGEMWNRRADGELYAVWITINTVYNDAEEIEKRVSLYSDITEKKQHDEQIWHHANYDLLTDLPNRRLFEELLLRQIQHADRNRERFALLFLDLDRFKEVNDTLGHHMGDRLLQEATARLVSALRESDLVARFGGDEFVIMLPELADKADIDNIAHNLVDIFSRSFEIDGEQIYSTASIGISIYPDDADNVSDLLRGADQAMYSSKRAGRSCVRYFSASMQAEVEHRVSLANDLRHALGNNEFFLEYQPIVSLSDGSIVKAEALVRWQHPRRGRVMPNDFIAIAEEIGVIVELGTWVHQTATQQLAHWRQELAPNLQISINRSPHQFTADGTSLRQCLAASSDIGLDHEAITIEITESTLLDLNNNVRTELLAFRDAGIQVAIDDFGVGYSSLAYLQELDIDILKIDRSFVSKLPGDSTNSALIEAIVVMAHHLGLSVIAEGVETLEQANVLQEIGCDHAQGYLYAKPLSVSDFAELFKHQTKAKI